MAKLWGGRFNRKTDSAFERFSASYRWDRRLLSYDVRIDVAQVHALRRVGVLTASEEKKLLAALAQLSRSAVLGKLKLDPNAEDVHSAVQDALKGLAGALSDKIHTGRSRNDLVSQSSRLYCKEKAEDTITSIRALQKAIVKKANEYRDTLIPGMTHLQNAQVLSAAHVFLAYAEMLERSIAQFETARTFADVCVLGSGALAGTTFALDQEKMARELGLSRVTNNSYDVSGDRDFVLAWLGAAAFLGVQLSRMAEDLMLAQTKGFSLMEVDQIFCTGSSMMPQKKNADFIELTRGASGVLAGNHAALQTTLKGLPTSYNRDLQWDKKSLFDSAELVAELLDIFSRAFATLTVDGARARLLMDETIFATDLADYLVRTGVPFKTAHEQVGRIVSFSEEKGIPMSKIGIDLLRRFAPTIDGDVYALFDAEHSVALKKTKGGTSPFEISRQIRRWNEKLKGASDAPIRL